MEAVGSDGKSTQVSGELELRRFASHFERKFELLYIFCCSSLDQLCAHVQSPPLVHGRDGCAAPQNGQTFSGREKAPERVMALLYVCLAAEGTGFHERSRKKKIHCRIDAVKS